MELTTSQKNALDVLENETSNVFLTGFAGTGKSFLISQFLQDKDQRNEYPVLGSTGVAALLLRGRTFHSFFGLGFANHSMEQTVAQACGNRNVGARLRKAKTVIIDEISMISGHLLTAAEQVARHFLQSSAPWGGLRVIVVGDFAQLPPVERGSQKPWAFLFPVWEESRFVPLILKENTRVDDQDFMEVLNKIRYGKVDEEVESFLNEKKQASPRAATTRLFPLRDQVASYNIQKLDEIHGEAFSIPTIYSGSEPYITSVKKNSPVDEVLHLKIGATVMIRMNDPMLRYVNGTIGKIVEYVKKDDILKVQVRNRIYDFEKMAFTWMDGQGEIKAKAVNFPIQLSWATTIHKSQGATLDSAWIDLTRFWEAGQAYVALSRVRNSQDLIIQDWSAKSIKADPIVSKFYERGCPYSFQNMDDYAEVDHF
ncbi:MAG: AAA family ATPase [Proteobacteria bacterium]|nr:AAA family ATPase [Pseudomonadota bacterium]